MGIDLIEARVIAGEDTIIRHVTDLSQATDYLFTSGGIGPTHDDITTASVAKAFGKAVIRHPEAVVACSLIMKAQISSLMRRAKKWRIFLKMRI